MYKFSKLFIKNILFSLLFLTALTVIGFSLLSSYIDNKTHSHQSNILAISQTFINDNDSIEEVATKLASVLTASQGYQTLIIKSHGKVLFDYMNNQVHLIDSILAKRNSISTETLNLEVQYQLNFIELINFLTQLLLGCSAVTLIFVFISARLNYKLQSVIFRIISKEISNELAQINDPDFITNQNDNAQSIEIPALEQGIDEIRAMMAELFNRTSHLETKAHIDPLTGFENRNRFIEFYENEAIQDNPIKFGVLLITRCSELQTINQVHGYHSGDNYLIKVADIIRNALTTRPAGRVFRLNGSDFATILPNEQLKIAEDYASELNIEFNHYQQVSELESIAFTGLIYFNKLRPLSELLALADTGVSVAQTQKKNSWYSQTDANVLNNNSAHLGSQNWRQEIDSVIDGNRITLLLQPIQPSGRNNHVYGEVLARFLNTNDDVLPTATFIAMAEKLDKIIEVDRLIIETVIKEITSKNMLDSSYGINISARSVNDDHFMIWLERKLLREPAAASKLVFEISEFGLQQNIKTAKRLVDVLHRVGARITVERFGVGLTSFKFFRDLKPDYIKMDSSYTRDIDGDKNNQYFLRLMIDLAHRLGINVLAESVESQEEKYTLEKLFIDGCQGYYVGKPAEL